MKENYQSLREEKGESRKKLLTVIIALPFFFSILRSSRLLITRPVFDTSKTVSAENEKVLLPFKKYLFLCPAGKVRVSICPEIFFVFKFKFFDCHSAQLLNYFW